ncbi:MAG: Tex-like N-terminal domain-containing protein, partial [Oscillospiraceae bacterium]
MDFNKIISEEFKIKEEFVSSTIKLIDEGNTIPFIARYRKELTGSLDDQVLRELFDRLSYLRNLEKRKEEVISSITGQEKMTDEISLALTQAKTLAEVEDIYRPYKQKRKTRASVAKEKGLEPLAQFIFMQQENADVFTEAEKYINQEKAVDTVQDAIDGAKDIIAEDISDDAQIRKLLRAFFIATASIKTEATKKAEENTVYTMYYDYVEAVKKIPGHRILAINRGEADEVLKVSLEIDKQRALDIINKHKMADNNSQCKELVCQAIIDGFDRLIFPSLEREIRSMLTEKASESAIKV